MAWWLENRTRMIQNNLRDVDARMDVDLFVENLKSFDANCVMVGAAGITAFYPTCLPFATRSPFLGDRDLLGEIVEKCHAADIRVVARFDFSKTHERFLGKHPDWYTVSKDGRFIHYNDTVHTCPCGEYQQVHSLATIRDVITKYPVDGIFFNMFGFTTGDYSGNQYGICHCEGCKKAFRAFSGRELPEEGDPAAAWEEYGAFKEQVVTDLLRRVKELTDSINPEIAVCTYHHAYVDMIRSESNSAVDRPLPFYLMQSAGNVAYVRGNWDGQKVSSNCVINATDIFYRFTGVSKELTRIRLYEEIAEGSGLDWCIIGDFADYTDSDAFEYVREVFRFHKQNERYFGHFLPKAPVAVLTPRGKESASYRGAFRMLKESHIPFRTVSPEEALQRPELLDGVKLALFPDGGMREMWNEAGRRGIWRISLTENAPVDHRVLERARARYLHLDDKEVFSSFPNRDWIIQDAPHAVVTDAAYRGIGHVIAPAWFGPPERCYGHEETGDAAAYVSESDKAVVVPFDAGGLYWKLGYEDHKRFVTDLIDRFAPEARLIETNAPNMVELFFDETREGDTLLQLLNLTGASGNTVSAHIPVHDIWVKVPGGFAGAESLTGRTLQIERQGEDTLVRIPVLEQYEAVRLIQ